MRPTRTKAKPDQLLAESREFHQELTRNGHNHRALVIIAGAYLDFLLQRLLSAGMADVKWKGDLFDGQGALATFSARIDVACAMGLLPESIRRDLHLIRKVRNHFAHRVPGGNLNEKPPSQWIESTAAFRFVRDAAERGGRKPKPHDFEDSVHVLAGLLHGCVDRTRPVKKSTFDLAALLEAEKGGRAPKRDPTDC